MRFVLAKRRGGLNPIALNSAQMLIGGPVLLLIALPFEGVPNLALPPVFYGQLLWLVVISAAAFAIWFHLLGKIKVSKLNLWKFIIPLSGAALSWIILPNESPTLPGLVGMGLIVIGRNGRDTRSTRGIGNLPMYAAAANPPGLRLVHISYNDILLP